MKLSRIALAVAVATLGLFGMVLFRTPHRSAPSKRSVRPIASRTGEPEAPEPVASPISPPAKRESAVPTLPAEPEGAAVTEVAMTPEVSELGAMLELSEEIAARAFELLRERDEAAERILEPYGGELSAAVILAVRPRLRLLDEEADRAIESILTVDQRQRYRTLRAEGFIPGTVLELPPAQLPDLGEDE